MSRLDEIRERDVGMGEVLANSLPTAFTDRRELLRRLDLARRYMAHESECSKVRYDEEGPYEVQFMKCSCGYAAALQEIES